MKLPLILVVLIGVLSVSSALADYKSELSALEKFEKDEFTNDKNYPPSAPGKIKEINKAFYDKLLADAVSLKYFITLSVIYRLVGEAKKDKALMIALESKFDGKKLDKAKWEKIFEVIANNIFKETNADHKKYVSSFKNMDEHYKIQLNLLKAATIK